MNNSIATSQKRDFSVIWLNRLALFIVFFWFGFLKIVGLSPAEQIVSQLHHLTIEKFISVNAFIPFLGIFECVIGIIWLFPRYTKAAFYLFCCQMATTFLPLLLMPNETWQSSFALSLSGQYIIKNVVLIASAYTVYKVKVLSEE
ncbi:hypothetical protein [Arcicella rigui]|uniref:DoxX family protein n=1 Tax=Arcicella rigui TaxID=797020 RepID=A0ABU5QFY9_9BACT|nr:hypothetical protein [Arcicella rigui]MEA5141785.1 hypothetical protein [Arcicella rigui]